MAIGKKTGEKKKPGGGGLPAQKRKTDSEDNVGKLAMKVAEEARAKKVKKNKILAVKKEQEKKKKEEEKEKREQEKEEEQEEQEEITLPLASADPVLAQGVKKALLAEKKGEDGEDKVFLSLQGEQKDLKEAQQETKKPQNPRDRAVIYLSHIPHGFYEQQMRRFFGQFGSVTNLRLARSKKTGKSCGYSFVEFKYREVAQIVADTMNNYLMFDRLVKCSLVSKERTNRGIFKGKVKENRPPGKAARIKAKKLHNAEKCAETEIRREKRQSKRVKKSLNKLKKNGIDYIFAIAETQK